MKQRINIRQPTVQNWMTLDREASTQGFMGGRSSQMELEGFEFRHLGFLCMAIIYVRLLSFGMGVCTGLRALKLGVWL